MALPVVDNFTAANGTTLGTYSASWTVVQADFVINTNALTPSRVGGVDASAYWNADTFPNDQYAQGVLSSVGSAGSGALGVSVRVSGTAGSGITNAYNYELRDIDGLFGKYVAGSFTSLGSVPSGATAGDTVRIEAQGTTITIRRNGSTQNTATDSSLASGAAGVNGFFADTTMRLDSWEGGSLAVTPQSPFRWGVDRLGGQTETRVFGGTSTTVAGAILAATGTAQGTGTATLALTAVLAGTGTAAATGSALRLVETNALAGAGTAGATGTATALRVTQPLAGAGAGSATGTAGGLVQTQPLAATGVGQAAGAAAFAGAGADLAASGTATAAGTAALRLTAALAGQGVASATGTAGLTPGVAGAILVASGTAQASGTAGLTPGVAGAVLAATGSATATGAATGLRLPRALAATGSATGNGTAALSVLAQLTLALTVGDHGAVTGNAGNYLAGTPAALTAVPDAGWQLGVWYVDGVPGGTANPLTLPMLADRQVGAVFIPAVVRHEADTWHLIP